MNLYKTMSIRLETWKKLGKFMIDNDLKTRTSAIDKMIEECNKKKEN